MAKTLHHPSFSLSKALVTQDKWAREWREIGERIRRLPEPMRSDLLEDILCAVQNRLKVMERIFRGEV